MRRLDWQTFAWLTQCSFQYIEEIKERHEGAGHFVAAQKSTIACQYHSCAGKAAKSMQHIRKQRGCELIFLRVFATIIITVNENSGLGFACVRRGVCSRNHLWMPVGQNAPPPAPDNQSIKAHGGNHWMRGLWSRTIYSEKA